MRNLLAFLAVVLLVVPAYAAQPVTINNPSNTDYASTDGSHNLNVNCQVGCSSITIAPSSLASNAITPVATSTAAASLVLKASPGNLYSVGAANSTASAGFLVVVNATSAPTNGSTLTPLACVTLPANGSASISYNGQPPAAYSTGIVALLTSASSCFTYTTGTITGFISGNAK